MNFTSSITLMFKDAFSPGFTQAKNSFAGMQDALGELGNNKDMFNLAGDISLAGSRFEELNGKLSALIDEPAKLAGQFDSSLRNIQSLTGETNAQLAETAKQILDIGGKAVAGPNAAADAFYNIASGVGRAEVRMGMLTAAINLSEAGQANLQAATSGLISVVNAYNTPAENMTALSDVFFQTVKKGVGSLDGFVSSMSSISGLSASVGIGFDELGSSMAFLTAKGQTESVAATQLKAAMVSLLRPNEELKSALQSIGQESGSAMLAEYGLAESLRMIQGAMGGSQDKMAKALGSVEALQAAIVLCGDDYANFAGEYAGGLSGATASALEAQAQSYEARVAKLQSANDALKIQIGDDINSIKGFFVDCGTSFLTNVAAPLMSSPVGEVFQKITAGAGLAAQGILSFGSGALNTASQLVTMTAMIQNAGGFTKLFGNTMGLLASPLAGAGAMFRNVGEQFKSFAYLVKITNFKTALVTNLKLAGQSMAGFGRSIIGVLPKMGAWIASVWAAAAAHIAAFWPVYAIIAGVALLAAGVVLLIKHWKAVSSFFVGLWAKVTGAFSAAFKWIQNLLAGVSNKVLAVVAVFFPFIGIPALIIKNWEVIKAFFVGLWVQVKNIFITVWNSILEFFTFIWNKIVGVVAVAGAWLGGVWNSITGAFAAAWAWVSNLFISIWEGIKNVILGFVAWLQPVIDVIIAPFKAIGNAIEGIFNKFSGSKAGGWVSDTVQTGKSELARMGENKTKQAAPSPVENAQSAAGVPQADNLKTKYGLSNFQDDVNAPSLTTTSAIVAPDLGGGASTTKTLSGGSSGSKNSALAGHLAAASRKGIAGSEINMSASDAFFGTGGGAALPSLDTEELNREAAVTFQAAMPVKTTPPGVLSKDTDTRSEKPASRVFNIQNVNLTSDDIHSLIDIARLFEMAALNPAEAAV